MILTTFCQKYFENKITKEGYFQGILKEFLIFEVLLCAAMWPIINADFLYKNATSPVNRLPSWLLYLLVCFLCSIGHFVLYYHERKSAKFIIELKE